MMKRLLYLFIIILLSGCGLFSSKEKKTPKKEEKEVVTVQKDQKKDQKSVTDPKTEGDQKIKTEKISAKEDQKKIEDDSGKKIDNEKDDKKDETPKGITLDQQKEINQTLTTINQKKVESRGADLLALTQRFPESPVVYYNYALNLYQQGNIKDALEISRKALSIKQNYGQALELLIFCYLKEDGVKQTNNLLKSKLMEFEGEYQVMLAVAKGYFELKNFPKVTTLAKEILKRSKNNPEALKLLAMSYFYQGNDELTLYVIRKTEEVDLNLPELFYLRGLILFKNKNYVNAKGAFSSAIELRKDFFEALDRLAYSEFKFKNYVDSEKYYKRALAIRQDFLTLMNFGNVLYRLKKGDEAKKAYEEAIKLKDNHPPLFYNLGMLYLTQDLTGLTPIQRYDEAIKIFEKYNKLLPRKDFKKSNADRLILDARTKKQIEQAKAQSKEALKELPQEEIKADDTKADDTKADDTKADDTKADDTKADDTKADDTKADDTKADDTKADDTKADPEEEDDDEK